MYLEKKEKKTYYYYHLSYIEGDSTKQKKKKEKKKRRNYFSVTYVCTEYSYSFDLRHCIDRVCIHIGNPLHMYLAR